MRKLILLVLVCLLASQSVAFATTYYVRTDGNDGNNGFTNSTGGAFRHIKFALQNVPSGSTILVNDGTYTGEGNIDVTTDNLTLQAINKQLAILDSSGGTGCQPSIGSHSNNLTIDGLKFTTYSSDACSGSGADAAIRGWQSNDPTQDPFISGPTASPYSGLHITNVLIDSTYRFHAGGIKTNQDNSIIENSEVHTQIECFNVLNCIIRHNNVYDGTFQGTFIASKGGARDTLIYGNIVHLTQLGVDTAGGYTGSGMILIGGQGGTYWDPVGNGYNCYNCVAFDNVTINESSTVHAPCFGFQAAVASAFFNNNCIGGQIFSGTDAGGSVRAGAYTSPSRSTTDPTFLNNIITAAGPGGTAADAYGQGYNPWAYGGTLSFDYNDAFGFTGATLSQTHAITGDPKFVNSASDWHLNTGSPAINSGTTVTWPKYGGGFHSVAFDFNGTARVAPWELGIYDVNGNKYWASPGASSLTACNLIQGQTDPGQYRSALGAIACMSGGDTMHMKAGTYNEARINDIVPNGIDAAHPSIIEGEGAVGCAIAENCNTIYNIDGHDFALAQYITLRNFKITGQTNSSGASCLRFTSSGPTNSGVIIDNVEMAFCYIHGIFTTTDFNNLTVRNFSIHDTNQGLAPIGGHGCYLEGTDTLLEHGVIHDITLQTQPNGQSLGCQIYDSTNPGTVDRAIVRYVEFRNITVSDALVIAGPSAQIYNNTFKNAVRGISLWGGVSPCYNGNKLYNNVFTGNTIGVQLGANAGGGCLNLTHDVTNNIIVGNTTNVDLLNGWTSSGSNNAGCGTACGSSTVALGGGITDCTNSPTDFHLKSNTVPCADAGKNIAGFSVFNASAADIGANENVVVSSCSVANATPSVITVNFQNNLWPPLLPATGVTGESARKNGSANTVISTARSGSNSMNLTVANAYLNGDTVDISWSGGNMMDSATIGSFSGQPYVQTLLNFSCTNNVGGGGGGGGTGGPGGIELKVPTTEPINLAVATR